jgi:hypothetical protein
LHVVSEAFAETGGKDEDAFTAVTTRAILDRACKAVGFDAAGARLMRLGENAMFRLREPVVVRVVRTAAYGCPAKVTAVMVFPLVRRTRGSRSARW